jgi:phosphatidate cytidylyltransferase
VERAVQMRRWITALVLIGGVAPIAFWGGIWLFFLLVGLVVVLCQLEFLRIAGQTPALGVRATIILVALFMPGAAVLWGERGLLIALTSSLILWMALEMLFRKELDGVLSTLGTRMLGYLYAALLPSYFVLLRKLPDGIDWILLTVTITAVGDTTAYYVGSLWGRRKLMPRISPHKTVEGALAGLLGNMIGAVAYGLVFFPEQLAPKVLLLALLVGVAGQLGDLSESMLKRAVGVKDSSGILPGHGGILDRLDSLLFSVPVVFYWVTA